MGRKGHSWKGRNISTKRMSHTLLSDTKKTFSLKKSPLVNKLAIYVSKEDALIFW